MAIKLDLNRLLTLKEKIVTAKEFQEPWDYFLTYFTEVPGFIEMGVDPDTTILHQILSHIAKTVLNKNAKVTKLLLKEIPGYHFMHGAVLLQGQLGNLIYFSDIDVGILAMLKPRSTSEFALVRFSRAQMEHDGVKAVLH